MVRHMGKKSKLSLAGMDSSIAPEVLAAIKMMGEHNAML